MMEKSAQAGDSGGCTLTPFQPITITYKVAVYAPAERADTLNLLISIISTQYVLCGTHTHCFLYLITTLHVLSSMTFLIPVSSLLFVQDLLEK
jgi:hypothetical protein